MKRTRTMQFVLAAGFLAALASATITSMAQGAGYSQVSYEVKYRDLFPHEVANIRTQLRNEREQLEIGIRNARSFIEKSRLIAAGRQRLQERIETVRRECPSTTLVIHGNASRSDVDKAIQDLRSWKTRPGGTVHVYGSGTSGPIVNQRSNTPSPSYTPPKRRTPNTLWDNNW